MSPKLVAASLIALLVAGGLALGKAIVDVGLVEQFVDRLAFLAELDRQNGCGNRLIYLATPPDQFPVIVRHLAERGEKILWAPDRHLGRYVQEQTGCSATACGCGSDRPSGGPTGPIGCRGRAWRDAAAAPRHGLAHRGVEQLSHAGL